MCHSFATSIFDRAIECRVNYAKIYRSYYIRLMQRHKETTTTTGKGAIKFLCTIVELQPTYSSTNRNEHRMNINVNDNNERKYTK